MDPPRLTCCLTFDFDAMSVWIGSYRSSNPGTVSRGKFGAVAIPRILNLPSRRSIRQPSADPGTRHLPGLTWSGPFMMPGTK